jgi:hypothetical protein
MLTRNADLLTIATMVTVGRRTIDKETYLLQY